MAKNENVETNNQKATYHIFKDFSKDCMSSIQPRCLDKSDEKLRSICVRASVCHGEETRTNVLQIEVFVGESFTIDRFTSSAISIGEISTLSHELVDDAVELAAFVTKSIL